MTLDKDEDFDESQTAEDTINLNKYGEDDHNKGRSKRESYRRYNTTEFKFVNTTLKGNSKDAPNLDLYHMEESERPEKSRAIIQHIRRKLEREEEVGYFLDAVWETEVSEGKYITSISAF